MVKTKTTRLPIEEDTDKIFQRLYNVALNFVAYQPRTEAEVTKRLQEYLYKKQITLSSELQEQLFIRILEEFKRFNYINDTHFVESYVKSKSSGANPKSKPEIKKYLYSKGIGSDQADEVLERYYDSEVEIENIKKIAGSKTSNYSDPARLVRYLTNRGFSLHNVLSVIDTDTNLP